MFVRIRVPLASAEDRCAAGARPALGADQAGNYLLVVDKDNVVQQRTVQTGQLVGQLRVIASGSDGRRRVVVIGQPAGDSRREGRAAGNDITADAAPPPPTATRSGRDRPASKP